MPAMRADVVGALQLAAVGALVVGPRQ
jgi:hypothetical protein